MKILVISACSARKRYDATIGCETLDRISRRESLEHDREHVCPAQEMYTGREHTRVADAVDHLQAIEDIEVDWAIISAGYGVVDATTEIVPYECTFSKQANTKSDFEKRAKRLDVETLDKTTNKLLTDIGRAKGIPTDLRDYDFSRYDLIFVALGEEYLIAGSDAFESCPPDTAAYAFTPESTQAYTGEFTVIPAGADEREKLGVAYLALKGTQLRTLAQHIESPRDAVALRGDPERVHSRSITPVEADAQ